MKLQNLKLRIRKQWIAVAAMAVSACCATAQSSDAIIDKLVEKGILTVKEANELREEADKNFNAAYAVKSGMPEWVTALKINGDFRARFDSMFTSATAPTVPGSVDFVTRNRFRYRVRLGVVANMFDNLETGLKLTSGDSPS